jgi:hypothetical protein
MSDSQSIVITVYGHDKAVDKIAVILFDEPELGFHDSDAAIYCNNINSLELRGEAWIFSRIISENIQYPLKAFISSNSKFDSILNLDDQVIQRMMGEVGTETLAIALKGEDKAIRDKIFGNMSKRAAAMLKSDMEFIDTVHKSDAKEKQAEILYIIRQLELTGETGIPYSKEKRIEQKTGFFRRNSQSVVITVYGHDREVDKFKVNLFDKPITSKHESGAKIYCHGINNQESQGEAWVFSGIISENTQYLLAAFLPLKFDIFLMMDDRQTQKILSKVGTQDLAKAMKGEDESIQERIFRNMPKMKSALLREDMEFMGPVHLCDVKKEQDKILKLIRQFELTGEIFIPYQYLDMDMVLAN